MGRIVITLFLLGLIFPGEAFSDSRIFLGTRTGWARTAETFTWGKYKSHRLFLVVGARPTRDAIRAVHDWETGSTVTKDVKAGAAFFTEQVRGAGASVPRNAVRLGRSAADLGMDPFREIQDFGILTPARIAGKTILNVLKIGWYGLRLPVEPVLRTGAGTLALAGSPFIQPVVYTGKYALLTGTAIYGYGSSVAGGAVLLGATAGVCGLDLATTPFVASYEAAIE